MDNFRLKIIVCVWCWNRIWSFILDFFCILSRKNHFFIPLKSYISLEMPRKHCQKKCHENYHNSVSMEKSWRKLWSNLSLKVVIKELFFGNAYEIYFPGNKFPLKTLEYKQKWHVWGKCWNVQLQKFLLEICRNSLRKVSRNFFSNRTCFPQKTLVNTYFVVLYGHFSESLKWILHS